MEKSFLIEVQKKLRIEELKNLEKELRRNIMKCLGDERKTNEKLGKRLNEVDMNMFKVIAKNLHLYFEYGSETPSKLRNLFWRYSRLMDIDKRLEDLNLGISDFKEMTDEEMTDEEMTDEEVIEELKMAEKV